ncbi:MAG: alkaline phosphatase family protein [Caulobacterales bacterium]|nr:alkaline phosphatase family protein [Caulobacterales bacterium]
MTRLLLIAAAGVDWPSLTGRIRAGHAPAMAALAARGAVGLLRSSPPRQGPAAWATVATGRLPEAHRVLRPEEPWAAGLRPLSLASWRYPPVWAALQAAGTATASVAWPGVRPGAALAGLHIDEDIANATGADRSSWALPLHCAPPRARDALRERRVHPRDITAAMLAPLVPDLAQIDQGRDTGLPRLAAAMARAATVQAAAAWALEDGGAEAVFVHHAWLGEVRDAFDLAGRGPFDRVIDGAWRFLDALVGRLCDLAGPQAQVLLVSPGRRSNPGALLAAGPGIAPGSRLPPTDALDIAPSILAAFGLLDPAAPGRAIAALGNPLEGLSPAPAVESPSLTPPDPALLQAALAAGYAPPAPVHESWRAEALAELAAAVVERDPRTACGLAAQALLHQPEHPLALGVKAMGHVALEEAEPLADLAETLMRVAPDRGWGALAHAVRHLLADLPDAASPWLRRAELDRRPEMLLRVATIWIAAGRPGEAERLFKAVLKATPEDAGALIGLAVAAAARRDFIRAEAALREALRLDPGRPSVHLQLAQVYAATGRREEARLAAEAAKALGAQDSLAAAAREGRLGA